MRLVYLGKEHAEGKDAIGDDASTHDYQAPRYGPVPEQVWVVRLEFALWIVIWEAHKASQRDGAY